MKKFAMLLMLSMTALLWSSCVFKIGDDEPDPPGDGGHAVPENIYVVNLPQNAPITQGDVIVKAYGVEISRSDDYSYSTSANAVSVVDKEGRTIYDCYASLDTLNSAHSLEINSLETAYTLLLPVFPNVFDYTSDQILATLKRLLSELPETQRLAVAIDKSIIEKGYLDMDAIETEYQSAVDAIVDRLGLRDNYLNGVGKKSYRAPASNPSLVNGDAIWGMKLVMNSSSWDEAGKTWVCKFTAYNENRFAYTAWVRGFKDGAGNVDYYNSDNYDIYRSSILKPQRVSTFMKTFTTWEGLKNYFGDTYHLIFDDDFEYSTWDKTQKSFTMGFTSSRDVVIAACPADNEMMMYYNVMKVVIDPIIKKVAKKLTGAEDDDYMLNFCIDLIADNNFRLSFSQIINGNKNWGAKAVDIMVLTWPKLRKYLDKVLQDYIKMYGEQYAWDHLGWTTAVGMEDALKEISKNWNKYVKAVEKSGDIILGILGLSERSFYYDLSLKFDEHGAAEHEYVDLGLPSGTLWATMNVGANNPEDYGDYFAWGETTPKEVYNWSTYKWCNGSSDTMTKYCTNSSYGYNGFVDNKMELDIEDDAATANWGSQWRMPSREQFQELINNCTSEWTTRNGVNGRLFTSKHNGASLFLPADGSREGNELSYAGSAGGYWSRTLCHVQYSYFAEALLIGSEYLDLESIMQERLRGRGIRAVRSSGSGTGGGGGSHSW
ncbi:MAG: hypothetical protein IJG81_05090 [Muribaculaceae bacterium]|nr:hypothetical protein [Muribaculaceae bacterium]